ncbi:MAG: site-specific integrase [Oscillospiraceae bacterium]
MKNLSFVDIQNRTCSDNIDTFTVGSYIKFWFNSHKQNLAPNTVASYQNQIKYISAALGDLPLVKLSPIIIQNFYSILLENLSPTSVLYIHRILRNALNRAVELDLLIKNPCNAVEPPRKAKFSPVVYSREDVVNMLNLLQNQNKDLFLPVFLAVELGLRRGEILGLYYSDFDKENCTLSISKSASQSVGHSMTYFTPKTESSNRTLLLSKKQALVISYFSSFRKKSSPKNLVLKSDNTFYTPATLNHAFSAFLAKNNLPHMRFHDLRHTNATLLLQAKIPAKIVSQRLGHSNISTTMDLYSHVMIELQEEASVALDNLFSDIS